MAAATVCSVCGRQVDDHDRHIRFTLPEPILQMPRREAMPGTWMSHATAGESVMMQVPGVGAFVRALVPVHLTGEDSVTFGVWVAIDPRQNGLRKLYDIWWDDARYAELRLDGLLANVIRPWDILESPVTAIVLDVRETPWCVTSSDATFQRILTEEWDREWVLAEQS